MSNTVSGHKYDCYDCYEVAISQAKGYRDQETGRCSCLKCHKPAEEYEPYGEEWRKEMMKFTKDQLIEKVRELLIKECADE